MKHVWRRFAVVVLVLPPAVAGPPARDLGDYVRLVHFQKSREDPGVWIGQTSVRELRNPESGATVVLLAITHIGRKDYYGSLTPHLRDAEVVLAEGDVGDAKDGAQGDELPPDARWVLRSYEVCARLLGLIAQDEWQDSVVDKRWVSADMDYERVLGEVKKGRLPSSDAFKSFVEQLEAALGDSATEAARADAKRRASNSIMRNFYEPQLTDEPEQKLDEEREVYLKKTIREQVAKHKRLAIVYGAWHMPVAEAALADLGFRLEGMCWLDCIVFEKPSEPEEKR